MRTKMIISFIIALLFLCFFFWSMNNLSYIAILLSVVIASLFLYNAARLMGRLHPEREKTVITVYVWCTFILYLIFLFSLTFSVDRNDARFIFSDKDLPRIYLEHRTNFVPFRSIVGSFKIGGDYFLINYLGNIAALSPMGFFLPRILRPARKLLPFTLFTTLIVIFIEFTQFLFTVGSVDIDDLILNVAGAVIMFLILRIRPVDGLLRRLFP